LKEWVWNIFWMIGILSFVELVLPEGGMQKYLKFIFSLMVLGIIVSPFGAMDFNEISASSDYFESKESGTVQTGNALLERIVTIQTRQIHDVYQEKVEALQQDGQANQNTGISIPWTDIYSIDGEDSN
jgi:stage III sporulation protein AF